MKLLESVPMFATANLVLLEIVGLDLYSFTAVGVGSLCAIAVTESSSFGKSIINFIVGLLFCVFALSLLNSYIALRTPALAFFVGFGINFCWLSILDGFKASGNEIKEGLPKTVRVFFERIQRVIGKDKDKDVV